MKEFTINGLVVSVEGANYLAVSKFVWGLFHHGIVAKIFVYAKDCTAGLQVYRLIQTKPALLYPQVCEICGQYVTTKVCVASLKEPDKGSNNKIRKVKRNKLWIMRD